MSETQNTGPERLSDHANALSELDVQARADVIRANIDRSVHLATEDNTQRYHAALAAIDRAQEPAKDHESPYTGQHADQLREILASEGRLTEERIRFRGGEIIRIEPEITRLDPQTGEPAIPLVFVRGMGANEALPWYMKQLAELDQRSVLSVMYHGRIEGDTGPTQDEALDGVAKIDVKQAEDLVDALDLAGVQQVDMIAESRGGIRAVVAMLKHPERFRRVVLKDIPVDERSFAQRHRDALRERVARIGRLEKPRVPESSKAEDRDQAVDRIVNARKEQKSVARARLGRLLAHLSPRVQATVSYDGSDEAFKPERVEQVAQELAHKENLRFVRTEKGGHGFSYDPKAIAESVQLLRDLED